MEQRSPQIDFGRALLLVLSIIVLGTGCASTSGSRTPSAASTADVRPAVGIASYYGKKYHGRKTASGETYNMHALTAAHRSLPFGTQVKVTNLANERAVVVRINDRGPFVKGRIVDVSLEAARRLQIIGAGTARVRLEPVKPQLITGTEPR
ncbi:MAG TPA: septal ring lytic transglycosylase RlpA family protein [Candidatus Binatia bacterium]|nr:septal ring lytic transglycosylase RlpA family protein [Candidatus Binatia bacterium]